MVVIVAGIDNEHVEEKHWLCKLRRKWKENEYFRLRQRHKLCKLSLRKAIHVQFTPHACIYTHVNWICLTYTRRNGNGVRVTQMTHTRFLSSWSSLVAEFVMRQIGDNDPHVIQNVCREIRFNLDANCFFYHLSAFNPFSVDDRSMWLTWMLKQYFYEFFKFIYLLIFWPLNRSLMCTWSVNILDWLWTMFRFTNSTNSLSRMKYSPQNCWLCLDSNTL